MRGTRVVDKEKTEEMNGENPGAEAGVLALASRCLVLIMYKVAICHPST
jgi:hypothetical protein